MNGIAKRLTGKLSRAFLSKGSQAGRQATEFPVLRCAITGMGMMGRTHAEVLQQHPRFALTGVVSGHLRASDLERQGLRRFGSVTELFESGDIDVLVISTPHWQHADVAIAALEAGLHVVCEKPLAVTVSQADAVMKAARVSKGRLTVVFQGRFEPSYQTVKALLAAGELGPIVRCEVVETCWRSHAYYRSSPWRGTWSGEGGGVLLNQAPHVLDRYLWLCGMPEQVVGLCDTALHDIEVEDQATAVLRHAGGMHTQLHISTNETPSTSRMVICCDGGRIAVDHGAVTVTRFRESIRHYTERTQEFFGDIESKTVDLGGTLISSPQDLLARFYTNFAAAVAGEEPLLVDPSEAANGVELANAILLSSATGRTVSLPLNRDEYDSFVADRIASTSTRAALA